MKITKEHIEHIRRLVKEHKDKHNIISENTTHLTIPLTKEEVKELNNYLISKEE